MDEVELATGLIFPLWFGGKCQEFMPFESESPFYFKEIISFSCKDTFLQFRDSKNIENNQNDPN